MHSSMLRMLKCQQLQSISFNKIDLPAAVVNLEKSGDGSGKFRKNAAAAVKLEKSGGGGGKFRKKAAGAVVNLEKKQWNVPICTYFY